MNELPSCVNLPGGEIMFRKAPPLWFISENFAPKDSERLIWIPKFKFECRFRTFKERFTKCGKISGTDFKCILDDSALSFSICNGCDPNVKEQRIRSSKESESPLLDIGKPISRSELHVLGSESISLSRLSSTEQLEK